MFWWCMLLRKVWVCVLKLVIGFMVLLISSSLFSLWEGRYCVMCLVVVLM